MWLEPRASHGTGAGAHERLARQLRVEWVCRVSGRLLLALSQFPTEGCDAASPKRGRLGPIGVIRHRSIYTVRPDSGTCDPLAPSGACSHIHRAVTGGHVYDPVEIAIWQFRSQAEERIAGALSRTRSVTERNYRRGSSERRRPVEACHQAPVGDRISIGVAQTGRCLICQASLIQGA